MIQGKAPFVCLLIPGTLNKKAPLLRCICRIEMIELDASHWTPNMTKRRMGCMPQAMKLGKKWDDKLPELLLATSSASSHFLSFALPMQSAIPTARPGEGERKPR